MNNLVHRGKVKSNLIPQNSVFKFSLIRINSLFFYVRQALFSDRKSYVLAANNLIHRGKVKSIFVLQNSVPKFSLIRVNRLFFYVSQALFSDKKLYILAVNNLIQCGKVKSIFILQNPVPKCSLIRVNNFFLRETSTLLLFVNPWRLGGKENNMELWQFLLRILMFICSKYIHYRQSTDGWWLLSKKQELVRELGPQFALYITWPTPPHSPATTFKRYVV